MQYRLTRLQCLVITLAMLCAATANGAELKLVGSSQCAQSDCSGVDAIVFVHGIYGDETTFLNATTGFNWPERFPRRMDDRKIDVYRLLYQNEMVGWTKNADFDALAQSVFDIMKPLRTQNYRTIGFIAHSLGGNVVSTYIHLVKTTIGHPQRSQNAFVVTLATPVLGSQWADRAGYLKSTFGMRDDLLASLSENNLYLRMLLEFRQAEAQKELRYSCRPVDLHAAYEKEQLGPILVVSPESAGQSISKIVASPVVGFDLDHAEMARPKGEADPLYGWVKERIEGEYRRVRMWEDAHAAADPKFRLCEKTGFIPED